MSLIIISVNNGKIADSEHACTDRLTVILNLGEISVRMIIGSGRLWVIERNCETRRSTLVIMIKLGKLPGNAIDPYLKQYGMQLCRKIEI
jgi:hypothetical protein